MESLADHDIIVTSTPKRHPSPTDRHERKTLQTLQLSATGKRLNGGKDCTVQQKGSSEGKQKASHHEEPSGLKSTHSSSQIVRVFEDSFISDHISITHCSRLTQTDDSLLDDLLQEKLQYASDTDDSGRESGYIDQEAYDLMVKEEVSETYWKDLAEERRRALKEILTENKALHSKLEALTVMNRKLQEENIQLKDIAEKAEAMKELLEGVFSDDEDTEVHEEEKCSLISESEPTTQTEVDVTGTGLSTDVDDKQCPKNKQIKKERHLST